MNGNRRKSFSKRHGHVSAAREIVIRHEAPEDLRGAMLLIAKDVGMGPSRLREIICQVLRKLPDQSNWSEYPNIWGEVQNHILQCEWFKVYDIAEGIYDYLHGTISDSAQKYEELLSEYFVENGIGWKMEHGEIVIRSPEAIESALHSATDALANSGKHTASTEIHEAVRDISRRPNPDVTGAIQHAMASLECLARDICDDPKATLGEILKKYPDKIAIPKPLDEAVTKAWGYASEMARHIREGRVPGFDEAELAVGLAAVIATYLTRKNSDK